MNEHTLVFGTEAYWQQIREKQQRLAQEDEAHATELDGARWFQMIQECRDLLSDTYEEEASRLDTYLERHEEECLRMTSTQLYFFLREVLSVTG